MYPRNQKTIKKPKKWLKITGLLVVLAIVVLGVLEATNTTHIFHKKASLLTKDSGSSSANSGTTNTKNATKDSGSTGTSTGGGPSSTVGQGVHQTAASDTSGKTSAGTSPSQWKTSASGAITLKSPVNGSVFRSGGLISGTAKVSKVWYRLVDNSAGVIAQGNLSVVNGKFSGTLSFHNYASGGQLDVYSFSGSGAEINEVRVNVNF